MAQVFRIADSAGSVTYDFLTGVLKPRANTWTTTPTGDGLVQETFELVGENTDKNIITAVQTIDGLIEKCDLFWSNPQYGTSVWLEYSATSENTKRALIHDMQIVPITRSQYMPILGGTAAFYAMTISRSEAWEDRAGTAIAIANLSALGGTATIALQYGDLPARINYLELEQSAGDDIDKVWIGIKPTRAGVSSFNPKWECELGTYNPSGDSGGTADATASGGTAVVCDFGTQTTLFGQFYITVDDICADSNYTHYNGRYLVLMRTKLSAAGNCGVQLRYQVDPVRNQSQVVESGEIKFVTSTSWNFIELGEVSIPPWSLAGRLSSYDPRKFALWVYAERNSGSPNLLMDCLILIPSEHMVYGRTGMIYVDTLNWSEVITNEKWEQYIVGSDIGSKTQGEVVSDQSFRNWYLPIEGGMFVIAGQDTSSGAYDDVINIGSMYIYSRYRTHNVDLTG